MMLTPKLPVMITAKVQRRILVSAVVLILLSIIMLLATLPGIIQDISAGNRPNSAAIGIGIAVLLRLLIVVGFRNISRGIKRDGKLNKAGAIVLGIGLLVLGIALLDGAFSFLEEILLVSIFMFISVFFDVVAAIITLVAMLIKPKKEPKH